MSGIGVVLEHAPIRATVTGEGIRATVTGGFGPPGAPAARSLAELLDVEITSAELGDVLRYDGAKWADYPDSNLTDGGAF